MRSPENRLLSGVAPIGKHTAILDGDRDKGQELLLRCPTSLRLMGLEPLPVMIGQSCV